MAHIAIIGSGVWGSAFAIHLARIGLEVRVWSRSQAEHLTKTRQHPLLPAKYPESIEFSADIEQVVVGASEIICMIPSSKFTLFLEMIAPYYTEDQTILWGCKGWVKDAGSIYFHEVSKEKRGPKVKMAALSGPTFADELALGKPTAIVVASSNQQAAHALMLRFHGGSLRCYCANSMATVQFCGVYKNIIAVAAGVADGLDLGANARSALITRGIAEMHRVAQVMGLSLEPIMGLAGLGDVMLSSTSDLSRNRRLGLALGAGESLTKISQRPGMGTLESTKNIAMMLEIAKSHTIELPIAQAVSQVFQGIQPKQILNELLQRDPVSE